jgi:hypothetical protein
VYGVCIGIVSSNRRRLTLGLLTICVGAIVLGMGVSFPATGSLVRLLYRDVPGYGLFREPQKWIALLSLSYAAFLSLGVQGLGGKLGRLRPGLGRLLVLLCALPLLSTSVMLWGFTGQVKTSEFPADWAKAAAAVSGKQGNLLFLPWVEFQSFRFAGDRILHVPADRYFPVHVLISDNDGFTGKSITETLDPRSQYVSRLLQLPVLHSLGYLLAPFGVRYIAVSREAYPTSLALFKGQPDLRELVSGRNLVLYENLAWKGGTYPLSSDAATELGIGAGERNFGALRLLEGAWFWKSVHVTDASATGTDRSCQDGWKLGNEDAECYLGAFAAFGPLQPGPTVLWRPGMIWQLLGYAVSGLVALGWVVLAIKLRRESGGGRTGE